MFNQTGDFVRQKRALRDRLPTVKCKSCAVGTPIRAFPELRDCPRTDKLVNAEADRYCLFYIGVEK